MKKFYLSAAVIAASLALPGLPATAQTNEIVIGITITTTGPAAALGIPERNPLEFATIRDRVQSRHHHGAVDHAAVGRGLQRRQRSRHSAFRSGAVPDYAGARQVVGGYAAAGADHGQGALRAHEGAQHQDRRLYRLFRFLR